MANTTLPELEPICALATAPGLGAIAVIRVTGKDAIALVDHIFEAKNKSKSLTSLPSHSLVFGDLKKADTLIDEVLISVFKNPTSYTGEDMVEISCHGSPYIQQRILEMLHHQGIRLAKQGEFTMRAYLNKKLDLSQAEAVADLIASENEADHALAMQQMRGGYTQVLQQLRSQLIDFTALLELELDFSEEDVEFADRTQFRNLLQQISKVLNEMIASFQVGNAIKEGTPVVIAGKPNAGKSSLLNALLNEDKAIVSNIAGTTRDSIEDTLVVDGVKFRIIDTAGIRDTTDEIEAIGVERALDKVRHAQILIYLFDLSVSSAEEVIEAVESLYRPGLHIILAQTHIDLYKHGEYEKEYEEISERLNGKYQNMMGLALKGPALEPTLNLLKLSFLHYTEKLKPKGNTIVSNARHVEALQSSQDALLKVENGMDMGLSGDLLAQDLRQALFHIGEITGEVDIDQDILGTIFGKFCIGK